MGNHSYSRDAVMNFIPEDRVAGVTAAAGNNTIRVEDACIAQIDAQFFLIVLLRIGVNNEEVIVIRISSSQANELEMAGVRVCRIFNTLAAATGGRPADILCAFVVNNFAYLVVRVAGTVDELRLVRVPLCTVLRQVF